MRNFELKLILPIKIHNPIRQPGLFNLSFKVIQWTCKDIIVVIMYRYSQVRFN